MPCDITYIVEKTEKLCKNLIVGAGFTNTTQFDPNYAPAGLRDFAVNAFYGGTAVWAWADNSTIADKVEGGTNVMVAVGKVGYDGVMKIGAPVQLTDLAPFTSGGFTFVSLIVNISVTINPTDPDNIIVSYGCSTGEGNLPCRAISFDGGKTWPAPYSPSIVRLKISGSTLTVVSTFGGPPLEVGQYVYTVNDFTDGGIIPYTTITASLGGGLYTVTPPQTVGTHGSVGSPPLNGQIPINPQNSQGWADNRGALADQYGNIWYSSTNAFVNGVRIPANQSIFAVSIDKGRTFQVVYTLPLPDLTLYPLGTFFTDFPQFCLGGNGLSPNTYGLWFRTNFFDFTTGDGWPIVGFIPIFDFNSWGSATSTPPISYTWLQGLTNTIGEGGIIAAADGRVWLDGVILPSIENSGGQCPFNYIQPLLTLYKSPGPLDQNYAGPWQFTIWNSLQENSNPIVTQAVNSQPYLGYFPTVQCIIYDENLKALYELQALRSPDYSQNMRLVFLISRNAGQTWSDPIDINSSKKLNRGFPSMALDPITGSLVFGWYDGRNGSEDPNNVNYGSVQYFSAIISKKKLKKLVNAITLSDTTFTLPSSNIPITSSNAINKNIDIDMIKNKMSRFNRMKIEDLDKTT